MDQQTLAALALAAIGGIVHNLGVALPLIIPILYTLLSTSFVDLTTGIWAAVRSGEAFKLELVGEYVRSHIALKVMPILLALLGAIAVGGTDSAAGLAGIAAVGVSATLYLTSTVASSATNISQGRSKTKGLPSGVPNPGP